MRAVVQRVSSATVSVDGKGVGSIPGGLLVYLSIAPDDGEVDIAYVVDKVRHLRIFPDKAERLNLDVAQAGGSILLVSAFTVQADARKGRRPSFDYAAGGDHARVMYELVCERLSQHGLRVERGAFGAMMEVQSVNAGPVCILLDSRRLF